MARYTDLYLDIMAELNRLYPGTLVVTKQQAMQVLGIKKYDTFNRKFPELAGLRVISKAALARAMTK